MMELLGKMPRKVIPLAISAYFLYVINQCCQILSFEEFEEFEQMVIVPRYAI
jgi:hypothetical protein